MGQITYRTRKASVIREHLPDGTTYDIIGRANYIYWSGFERFGRIGAALK